MIQTSWQQLKYLLVPPKWLLWLLESHPCHHVDCYSNFYHYKCVKKGQIQLFCQEKNLSVTVASVRRSSGGSLHIVEVTYNVYIHIHQIDISFESKRKLLDSWGEWILCHKNGFSVVTSIRLSSTPLPSFRGWCASCTSAVHNLMSSPCANQKLSSKVFHQDICYFVWVDLAWGRQLSWS